MGEEEKNDISIDDDDDKKDEVGKRLHDVAMRSNPWEHEQEDKKKTHTHKKE